MTRPFLLVLILAIVSLRFIDASVRIVSPEELAKRNGKGQSGEIWLSILGEVYDVTSGSSFYGGDGAYSVFAGRDGSVPFITGVFTEEEANKSTDFLSGAQLSALEHWRQFYADNDEYPFVGLLEGRFYDKVGNPQDEMKSVKEKIEIFETDKEEKKKQKQTEL